MPRRPRIDFPGARHHVMNRGARHAPVFFEDDDCSEFLDILAQLPERYGVQVHGYALMPNHYHLMLQTPRANLSDAMRHLGARFTQHLNRRHAWDGPIFRGRFHNRVVVDDAYWAHLLAYLHMNPVRARLASRPGLAPWTSHRAYVGLSPAPPWLWTAELLALHGGRRGFAAYLDDLQRKRRAPPEGFEPASLFAPVHTAELPSAEATIRSALEFEPAVVLVERLTGRPFSTLARGDAGRRGDVAAAFAAWTLHEHVGLSLPDTSAQLAIGRSATGRRVRRFRQLLLHDAVAARWAEAIVAAKGAMLPS